MKIGFLITARLKSSRLKLKLLKLLNNKTVIEHVIKRAKTIQKCDEVILCTSQLSQDLPLVKKALKNDISYYTGSEEDVLQRLLEATELFKLAYFIGITADNPLFSTYHANLLIDLISSNPEADFAYTSGMPIGVNIYVIKAKALKTVCAYKEEKDTEIWGYLINRPEIFNIIELPVNEQYIIKGIDRLTLDYQEDYELFKRIFGAFDKDEVIDILDAYEFLDANKELKELNNHKEQLDISKEAKTRISKFFEIHKERILTIKEEIYKV